jgi:3-oxoadipate enol-lactonase
MADLLDIRLAYDTLNNEAPNTVLLVHGHPFDRSMWTPQMQGLLGHDWRVLVPDLRGYGDSSVTEAPTTLDRFAADLFGLLDAAGRSSAVLCGLSMGGQIVMEMCRMHPDRVRGVLLAATFPQPETEEGKIRRNQMADRLLREGMAGYAAETLPKMLSERSLNDHPDIARHVLRMMSEAHPVGAAAALRGRALRPSYEPVLASLQCPATIVVGDEDAFTSRADADLLHRLIEGSSLVWLRGIGHMPNLESPEAFNTALVSLLRACGPDDRDLQR